MDVLTSTLRNSLFFDKSSALYGMRPLCRALNVYIEHINMTNRAGLPLLNNNVCFGLSIIFSTMFNHNQHNWWLNLLKNIITSANLLNNDDYLDSPATDWHLENNQQIYSHRQLIDRALNYILLSSARLSALPKALASNVRLLHQKIYLYPRQKHAIQHEYAAERKIETINQHGEIAGYFDATLLSHAIDSANFSAGNIIKIAMLTHACSLIYDDESLQFGFYDPSHHSGEPQWFSNKAALCQYILESLGCNLIVTIASINGTAPCLKPFQQLLDSNPADRQKLLSNNGYTYLFQTDPTLANDYLTTLPKRERTALILEQAANLVLPSWPGLALFAYTENDQLLQAINDTSLENRQFQKIIKLLPFQYLENRSCLYMLVVMNPLVVLKILEMVSGEPPLEDVIIKAFEHCRQEQLFEDAPLSRSSLLAIDKLAELAEGTPQNIPKDIGYIYANPSRL